MYTLNNLIVDVEKFPPAMPDKKMLFNLSAWIFENRKKIMLGEGSMIGSVERKYIKKNYFRLHFN